MKAKEIGRVLAIAQRAPVTLEERAFLDDVSARFRHRHHWTAIRMGDASGGWRNLCSDLDCGAISGPPYPTKDEAYRAFTEH